MESEGDILELADFLGVQDRPAVFRVLPCLGVFRDEVMLRFAVMFRPPPYIERIPGGVFAEGAVSRPRKPTTLLDMLNRRQTADRLPSILPLGDRFRLATNLAQSLYVMHAAGWIHKKYAFYPQRLGIH